LLLLLLLLLYVDLHGAVKQDDTQGDTKHSLEGYAKDVVRNGTAAAAAAAASQSACAEEETGICIMHYDDEL
jgi:hypothetical protein